MQVNTEMKRKVEKEPQGVGGSKKLREVGNDNTLASFSMISSRIISFQKMMVESRQVLHPLLTL